MYEFIVITFLIVAVAIIVLVLLQNGKGADMGASFGAGASGTIFGSSGTGSFLTKLTTGLGIVFFLLSIALANIANKPDSTNSGRWNISDDSTTSVSENVNKTSSEKKDGNEINISSKSNATSDIPE